MSEQRLTNLVRVLAVLSLLLAVIAGLEAASLRHVRDELQQLRTERDTGQNGAMSAWAAQTRAEFVDAARWLDQFYREPTEGFGRPDGLCPKGVPDYAPVATWVLGTYVPERTKGLTIYAARNAMDDAIRRSDEYRARHPIGK